MEKLGGYVLNLMTMFKHIADVRTVLLALIPFAILFWLDPAWAKTQWQLLTSLVVFVGLSHFIRKAMFPDFDLQKAMETACETPMGAAIVSFGMLLFVTMLLVVLSGSVK